MTDPNFQIAFCIICHKYTPVLQELVDRLQAPGNDLFVHVDGKSDLKDFTPLQPQVRFVKPRTKVYWGSRTQIECTLRLFEATRCGNYRYIVLLSGDTLPLRPIEEIRDFLASNYGQRAEFVDMQPQLCIQEIKVKLLKRHYIPEKAPRNFRFRIQKRLAKLFRTRTNRLFWKIPPIEKGSNWIAITDRFRDYALDYLAANPDYYRCFKYSDCGDELFFQTILASSPMAPDNTRHSLMFTEWTDRNPSSPSTLGSDRIDLLATVYKPGEQYPNLFARKIADDFDLELFRQIIPDK